MVNSCIKVKKKIGRRRRMVWSVVGGVWRHADYNFRKAVSMGIAIDGEWRNSAAGFMRQTAISKKEGADETKGLKTPLCLQQW